MKKTLILLFLISFSFFNISLAKEAETKKGEDVTLPNIFIWHIPDETPSNNSLSDNTQNKTKEEKEEEEISLKITPQEIPLKGYAEYEDNADTIYLKDEHNNFVLNLRVPQKFNTQALNEQQKTKTNNMQYYSRFNSEEYRIAPQSFMAVEKRGCMSYGTLFNSGIDNSQLERSTTLFTKYDSKYFSISSAYKKNNLTAYGLITDNFYIAPELKLNRVFSLTEVLSTDLTRNRRKGEFVLSISPLKDERMIFELGAGTTYDVDNDRSWSQVRFNTKFKL